MIHTCKKVMWFSIQMLTLINQMNAEIIKKIADLAAFSENYWNTQDFLVLMVVTHS